MVSGTGLRITRQFTKAGEDPLDAVEWGTRDSRITNPDGSIVFEMKDAEVPRAWSQVAADIMVSKYFRKAGVPQVGADGTPLLDDDGKPVLGPEHSARQVIRRLTSTWRWWGARYGYFGSDADADAFEDELSYMLVTQMAAPNSPQWFNTGLNHAYGITGPPQGFWYVDPDTGRLTASADSYSRPPRTPASSSPSRTIWSTRAGSWTSGSKRPGSSSTAPEPAPTSRNCAPRTNLSPEGDVPPA